jgi:type IV pilus assembly protein PilQ
MKVLNIRVMLGSLFFFMSTICSLSAQDRMAIIEVELDMLSITQKGLDEEVELSVTATPVSEFIRSIALAHKLNISVSPELRFTISNNFANAEVSDVLLFLCNEYDLDIEIIGSIITFKRYHEPTVEMPEIIIPVRIPRVSYVKKDSLISLDLKNDSLGRIVQEITKKTAINIILGPDVKPEELINIFIKDVPFTAAINKLAYANNLVVNTNDENFFILEKKPIPVSKNDKSKNTVGRNNSRRNNQQDNQESGSFYLEVNEEGKLSVEADNASLDELISQVSKEYKKNYFLYSALKGNVSLFIENVGYDEFLSYLLTGTEYTHLKKDSVYLIGDRSLEKLRMSEIFRFKFRTVEDIISIIPGELKKGLQITEFRDLNGLVLSGGKPQVDELKLFLEQIDQVVPMVQIEVLIVDVSKSTNLNFGISATLGGEGVPENTSGTIFPEYNMNLNSESVNGLINNFNGLGLVNLGKVTSQFYMNINALEKDGLIKVKSTPKLSTINGQEAVLSIGQTEYYLQVNNSFIGSQNPSLSRQENWQPVNASLSITINPMVSSDGNVTLTISVTQSSFTERVSSTAPPGAVNKDFKSTIRVKNGEMILLGGLENKSTSNSGDGFPFLSRIPIIKWFFSRRIKEDKESKFNLFIKPTVF